MDHLSREILMRIGYNVKWDDYETGSTRYPMISFEWMHPPREGEIRYWALT